jgi:hypothetical protein
MVKVVPFCRVITREELYLIDSGAQFKVFSLTYLLYGVNLKRGELIFADMPGRDHGCDQDHSLRDSLPAREGVLHTSSQGYVFPPH